ncbi:MAG: selenium-dependent molybdenum cofactor biosynthesis protein YqeB [Dehalococcoidia bacterium]|jgi:xanthine dehydrogenase accessory factor
MDLANLVVLIRSGGEVASGVAHKLARARFRVCMTETAQPLAVSRGVAFCEAIYEGEKEVEGIIARRIYSPDDIARVWRQKELPILVDPETLAKDALRPAVLIDALMAKKNTGTRPSDAPLVIGLGPGFKTNDDVHVVIETNNSERLGRVITRGGAEANTGIPVTIGGLTTERVWHSPSDGQFLTDKGIGDMVAAGDVVARVGEHQFKAEIDGVIRALLRDGTTVTKGTKLGEVDPSKDIDACYTIRPRVRAIAGGVLEAIMMRFNV